MQKRVPVVMVLVVTETTKKHVDSVVLANRSLKQPE
jgi:hypothetical protein